MVYNNYQREKKVYNLDLIYLRFNINKLVKFKIYEHKYKY